MTLPQQEHNSLLATREFLKILLDNDKFPNLPEKVVFSAKSLLEHYPTKTRINELYQGNTFDNFVGEKTDITEIEEQNNNRIYNNNQTWDTPGYKWKTEVEYIRAK